MKHSIEYYVLFQRWIKETPPENTVESLFKWFTMILELKKEESLYDHVKTMKKCFVVCCYVTYSLPTWSMLLDVYISYKTDTEQTTTEIWKRFSPTLRK